MERRDVYVELLKEGTPVWRPAVAYAIGEGLYVLSNENHSDDEIWAVPPGDVVTVERKTTDRGAIDVVAKSERAQ